MVSHATGTAPTIVPARSMASLKVNQVHCSRRFHSIACRQMESKQESTPLRFFSESVRGNVKHVSQL